MGISTRWFSNIRDPDKKKNLEELLKNNKTIFTRLSELLQQDIDNIDDEQANFEDPNWPYKQAALVAEKKAYKRIKRLINFE